MKNYKVAFHCLLILVVTIFANNKSFVEADQLFDGGGYGVDYSNSNFNVPMPSNPSPPPSSGSNDNSSNTYTKPKTYTKPSSSLITPQMRDDIVDSVYNQIQMQAKQKALAAQKLEEEKMKQEAAKKQKDTQNWLRDYQADASPKINDTNTKIKLLDGFDPVRKLKESNVPAVGQVKDSGSSEITVPKLEPQTTPVSGSKIDNPELTSPGKSEGELREMYYNSDREIMQCASGKSECSPEYVKALQMKRLTAEQGLTIHYNFKEVNGQFIKKP